MENIEIGFLAIMILYTLKQFIVEVKDENR